MCSQPTERDAPGDVGDIFRLTQGRDRSFEASCIPQDGRGGDEVRPGNVVLLVLVGAVADFAEPMNENGARQTVAGFPLVQLLTGLAPQFGILNPARTNEPARI